MHWWVPALATAAFVAHLVLPEELPGAAPISLIGLTLAYTALGLRVLRMTDAEWDGVRPIDRTEAPIAA